MCVIFMIFSFYHTNLNCDFYDVCNFYDIFILSPFLNCDFYDVCDFYEFFILSHQSHKS